MVAVVRLFGWEFAKTFGVAMIFMVGTFFAATALHFPELGFFLSLVVPIVIYLLRNRSVGIESNLTWLQMLPLSRRALWLTHYGLSWLKLGGMVLILATSLILASNIKNDAHDKNPASPETHHIEGSLERYQVFGSSVIPYAIFILIFVHGAMMIAVQPLIGASAGIQRFHASHFNNPNPSVRLRYRGTLFFGLLYFLLLLTFPPTHPFHLLNYFVLSTLAAVTVNSHSLFAMRIPADTARRWFWRLSFLSASWIGLGAFFVT